jgi:tetratricopeptide (TPR) repeat protein
MRTKAGFLILAVYCFIAACVTYTPYGPESSAKFYTVQSHLDRAWNYDQQGLYDQAIAEYNQALLIEPNKVSAYNNRGVAYWGKGLHKKALADWTQALRLDPNLAAGYANMGSYQMYEANYGEAINSFNHALNLDPKMAQGYVLRALAFYYQGEYDKAWEDVHRAQSLGTVVDAKFLEALNKPSDPKGPDRSFIEDYGKYKHTFKFIELRVPSRRDWPFKP